MADSDNSSWNDDGILSSESSGDVQPVEPEEVQPDPEILEDFYFDEDEEHWLSEDHLLNSRQERMRS
jgi:hypothetical protein